MLYLFRYSKVYKKIKIVEKMYDIYALLSKLFNFLTGYGRQVKSYITPFGLWMHVIMEMPF